MMGALRRGIDAFWGRGAAAVTVPSMDGALRPNGLLDRAPVELALPAPDSLVECAGEVLVASGAAVIALQTGAPARPKYAFAGDITALASHPSGALAVAMSGEIALRGGAHDGTSFFEVERLPLLCPTAVAFDGPDCLIVCLGSATNPPQEWKRDLLQCNASGSVWRVPLGDGAATRLADGLSYPSGVFVEGGRPIRVSEAWRHRVVRLLPGDGIEMLVEHLPGYPGRMSAAADGGSWLTVFAPRRQMVEFVLRERAYRERMMREVLPDYWMAPALRSRRSFLEPIQGGAVKHLGVQKPWAPTLSYGLVIRLDKDGSPVASLHSRADGVRHGVTSCLDQGDRLLVASKGGDVVLSVDLAELDQE